MTYNIVPATIEDEDRVFDFLQKHFYPDEPLNNCLGRVPKDKEECAVLSILDYNLSLLAVEKEDPAKICGLFLNKRLMKDDKDETWNNFLKKFDGTTYGKVLKFLDYVDNKFEVTMNELWDQTQTTTAMDICVAGVRSDCRRQNISSKLMEQTLQIAKMNKMKCITIKCTSAFSAGLAQKYGFSQKYYLPYKDYRDENGEAILNIGKPHEGFRGYTKCLEG